MTIRQFQRAVTCIGNKNYNVAFTTIYGNDYDHQQDYHNIVEPLMQSERCKGNFYAACDIYEKVIAQETAQVVKARQSNKVRQFIHDYKTWSSGYAMGECIKVIYYTTNRKVCDIVADNRKTYEGRGSKYNRYITYGEAVLIVDMRGKKTKYSMEITSR